MRHKFKLLTICLLLSSLSAFAQDTIKDMTLLSNWRPQEISRFNDIWGYTDCQGREYAIIGSARHVHFVDISDPSNPREIERFAGGEETVWRDIKTYRDRAYAVSDNTTEGLIIFDLSQLPNRVTKTYHSNAFFNNSHNIFIDNGRLYCAGTNTENDGLLVLDIATDPDRPRLLATAFLQGGEYVHDVYVRNDTAYCSHGYEGFYMWDFSNPTNPQLIASIETGAYNHSSWVTDDGKYALYAEEVPRQRALGIIELEDAGFDALEIVSLFQEPLLTDSAAGLNTPHNPFIRGDYAVVSYYEDGIQIFDLRNPLMPQLIAYFDTYQNTAYRGYNGCWGAYPFFESGVIIASDISSGLFVLRADSIDWKPLSYPRSQQPPIIRSDDEGICPGSLGTAYISNDNPVLQWERRVDVWTDKDQTVQQDVDSIQFGPATTVYAIAYNAHCPSDTQALFVPAYEVEAPMLTIDIAGGTISSTEAAQYQWYKGNEKIEGATNRDYLVMETGIFFVEVVDFNGCIVRSQPLSLIVTSVGNIVMDERLMIYPNPATDFIRLVLPMDSQKGILIEYSIYNAVGSLMQSGLYEDGIQVNNLSEGMYVLQLKVAGRSERLTTTFIKMQ